MSTTVLAEESHSRSSNWLQWLLVLGLVYLLLVAVAMIGTGFKAAPGDQAKELFAFASNPITGVIAWRSTSARVPHSRRTTSRLPTVD